MEDKERNFLREQILKQEKLASIGTLTAGIAHEVQNPLNFVLNFSRLSSSLVKDLDDIIKENSDILGEDTVEEIKEITNDLSGNLNKVVEHGNRALDIVRSILLHSRGKSEEFLPTDIPFLVHEYVWLSYHSARAADRNFNVSIVEYYPDNMPQVMVVPQDLSRAVVNCINNSFYAVMELAAEAQSGYAPEIRIIVSFSEKDKGTGELSINITDNGIGMTPEVRERLFENFFTTKPAGKGTGLGMGIVRHIIEDEHRGRIEIESAVRKGTSVSFTIPVKTVR